MQTLTLFTLIDGTEHKTVKSALNHCDEMMGAKLRGFVYEMTQTNSVYKSMLDIVCNKKYDTVIFEYVKWRKEKDAIIEYLNLEQE